MKKIDTFSANSLKVLNRSLEEFKNRYILNLYLNKKDERTLLGQKFHSLICAYLRGFNTDKMAYELDKKEIKLWDSLIEYLKDKKNNFIQTEYSFLTKNKINNDFYYLTGRYDAIYKENDDYIIYDWKTLNLPKDPQNDLQSIVYLNSAYDIFKTDKIKIRYLSIENLNSVDIDFKNKKEYENLINSIILKYYN